MGINAATAKELFDVFKSGVGESIITYGVQNQIKTGYKHQKNFFEDIGFSTVHALDLYTHQNPDIIADLNKPIDEKFYGKYDCVLDGGTMEHIFSPADVLYNSVRLLKVGGRIIHLNPLTGWINHGFYQISPTLYYDFYSENGFNKMDHRIRYDDKYRKTNGKNFPKDMFHKKVLQLFTAIKIKEIENFVIPIQGKYKNKFGRK
jgi:hypothetical protein